MSEPFPLRCDSVREHLKLQETCCGSCHDDEDEGFSLLCGGSLPDGTEYEVCCAVSNAATERMKQTFDVVDVPKEKKS